jgi:hypothetical protein
MFEKHTILGVHITDRTRDAVEVQKALTEYGRQIKTRLGLHEIEDDGTSANSGLLILEMVGPDENIQKLADQLNDIMGVEVQSMVFHHPE